MRDKAQAPRSADPSSFMTLALVPNRRMIAAVTVLVSVVLAIGFFHGGSSTTPSTSAAAASTTTPLGCAVHAITDGPLAGATATDDSYCTQRQLASRLCDINIGTPMAESGALTLWQGPGVAVESNGQTSGMTFNCTNGNVGDAHNRSIAFTWQEWHTLLAPGDVLPARYAATLSGQN